MARFGNNEKEARANAQANANRNNEPWCVFIDTSGAWNSERYHGQPLTSWSGVTVQVVEPQPSPLGFPKEHPVKGDLGTIPL